MGTTSTLLRGVAVGALACSGLFAAQANAADREREFEIIGRLQLDWAQIDATDFGDGDFDDAEMRRGRIGIAGQEGPLGYKVEISLSESGEWALEDVYGRFNAGPARITIGHFKPAVSLNNLTSSRHINSMERAGFTQAFGFGRRLGVGADFSSGPNRFAVGVFSDNSEVLEEGDGPDTYAIAGRWTRGFEMEGGGQGHFGASAQYRDMVDGSLLRYRSRPGAHLASRYVATPRFAESDIFVGGEAAFVSGPFHVAGEYGFLAADGPGADANFHGGYVEAGYFLTPGDSRGYRSAKFDRTRPERSLRDGGWGAWEARGRLDYLSLDDGAILGGEQTSYTAGVNAYLTDYIRVMTEYVHTDVTGGPSGSGDFDAFQIRFAMDWAFGG